MSEDMVSKDFLFFLTDFLVDELAQNDFLAEHVKGKIRQAAANYPKRFGKDGEDAQAGSKRKGAPGGVESIAFAKAAKVQPADNDEDMEVVDGAANGAGAAPKKKKKEKKKRKVNIHQVFISAAMDAIPPEKKGKMKGGFKPILEFKKTLSPESQKQFDDDYASVRTTLDEAPERVPDDMKRLIKERNKELGIEVHPVLEGVKEFLAGYVHAPDTAGKAKGGKKSATKEEEDEQQNGAAETGNVATPDPKKGKGKGAVSKLQKVAQEVETSKEKERAKAAQSKKHKPGQAVKAKDIKQEAKETEEDLKEDEDEDTDGASEEEEQKKSKHPEAKTAAVKSIPSATPASAKQGKTPVKVSKQQQPAAEANNDDDESSDDDSSGDEDAGDEKDAGDEEDSGDEVDSSEEDDD